MSENEGIQKKLTSEGASKDGETNKIHLGKKGKGTTFLSQNAQGHKFT